MNKRQTIMAEHYRFHIKSREKKRIALMNMNLSQFRRLYKNKVLNSDHVQSPLFLKAFIENLKEKIVKLPILRDNKIVDIVPFKCDTDNLSYAKWSNNHVGLINPPFSGHNNKLWLMEAVKFVEKRNGTIFIVTQFKIMSTKYFADYVANNQDVDSKVWILRKNWGWKFNSASCYGQSPSFASIVILLQPVHHDMDEKGNYTVCHSDIVHFWENPVTVIRRANLLDNVKGQIRMDSDFWLKKDEKRVQNKCINQSLNG